ncbi:hypothetical protein OsJ_21809 [Oryza sativa Japonica Group]|uniref:Uncharacterized protein n=1 Tax=Oryza sativa subsp. japonica TaxID=39947 RepID=B9FTX6_ORYSJ|nr:hypothetical protein OsJ_21809 [Oryza sativa Japonica Group]
MAMPSIRAALLCMAPAIAVVPLYDRLRDRDLFRPSTTTPVAAAGDANQAAETRNYTNHANPTSVPHQPLIIRLSDEAASPNHADYPTPIIIILASAVHPNTGPKPEQPPQEPDERYPQPQGIGYSARCRYPQGK